MRIHERGIGNLAFIAAVLLFLIATALFFVKESESSDLEQKVIEKDKRIQADGETIRAANAAYNELVQHYGANIAEIPTLNDQSTANQYPRPEVIRDKLREWLFSKVTAIQEQSKATLVSLSNWQIPEAAGAITVSREGNTTITLYGTPFTKETMTVANVLDPLPAQFGWAVKAIEANNGLYEQTESDRAEQIKQLTAKNEEISRKYEQDVQQKQQAIDTALASQRQASEAVTEITARLDQRVTKSEQEKDEALRQARLADRARQAAETYVRNAKMQMDRMIKEDPKDGEVLVAETQRGIVFINLGTRDKLRRGTKFTVWRTGKGNVRDDVARIQVIEVERTMATCRVLQLLDSRVPVTKGMSVSNPFYDPLASVKVFIYGNLRTYPTDIARRRLAESGVEIMRALDDTVNIIVLGEPPVSAPAEFDADDPDQARLAERRLSADRAANLRNVYEQAVAIGAIIVSEAELAAFIDY